MIDDIDFKDISDDELDAWITTQKPEQIEILIEHLMQEEALEIYP